MIRLISSLAFILIISIIAAQAQDYGCFKTDDGKILLTAEFNKDFGITRIKYKNSNEWILLKVKTPEKLLPASTCVPSITLYNEVIKNKVVGTYKLYKCGINMDLTYRKKGGKKDVVFHLSQEGDEIIKKVPCY